MLHIFPQNRPQRLKLLAFLSVTFSTFATFCCLFAFPSLLAYVTTMKSAIDADLRFCKIRSRDLWIQIATASLRHSRPNVTSRVLSSEYVTDAEGSLDMSLFRVKREPYSGGSPAVENPVAVGDGTSTTVPVDAGLLFECCTCHRGNPGKSGESGRNGLFGVPGEPGEPGNNGQNGAEDVAPIQLPEPCPCEADVGPEGARGGKGEKGRSGIDGPNGQDGRKGGEGNPGLRGSPGIPGLPGKKGSKGGEGKLQIDRGKMGTPGSKGLTGPPGLSGKDGNPGNRGLDGKPGIAGRNGKNGIDGLPGRPGEPGVDGDDGAYGSCVHCPPARLSPGY